MFVFIGCDELAKSTENKPDTPQEEIPNVTNAFVNVNKENLSVLTCDTVEGRYSVRFNGSTPSIKSGSVMILPTDSVSYVLLVTKANTQGQTVDMEAEIGDLSYVYSDTEFTFETGEDETRASNGLVFYPEGCSRATWQLWSASETITHDIFNSGNARLWTEAHINATVQATINFKFGKPVESVIKGIKFLRAKNFDVDFSIRGDVGASYDVNLPAAGKGNVDLAKGKEKYALLKHNLFPQRNFVFPVGPVQIPVSFGCDLFADVSLAYDASVDFNTGIDANASGTAGATFNGTTNSNLQAYRNMSLNYNLHYPTLKGKGELEGKVHVFPRIHAWICGFAGPSVDIKPYAKVVAGGSFQEVVGNSSEDYIAASLKTYVGLDVAAGLSRSSWNYETWNLSTPDFNIGEYQLYESPVDIKYLNANKNNDGTIDVSFEVYDRGMGKTTFLSPLWPVVKFEADGNLEAKYVMAHNGVATAKWKPKNNPSKLYAKIYDMNGGVIAQAEYESEGGLTSCPDSNHPHAIDLGLPSGTKWACCNVGASTPEGYGGYYAWGEVNEKSVYNEVTYQYSTGTDTDGDGWYEKNWSYQNIGSDIAGTSYDVAYVRMGGSWRMPSDTQEEELMIYCKRHTWTQQNGVNGILVTGKNGGSIFLPAAGFRWSSDLSDAGSWGYYWLSTLYPSDVRCAYYIRFTSVWPSMYITGRNYGFSVRAVCP